MKQFFYALKNLLNGRGNNLIKVVSLTLGLVVALVLFSKVAFEMTFDTAYPDADRIYQLVRKTAGDGKKIEQNPRLYAPVVRDLQAELPEIETGTTTMSEASHIYLHIGEKIFREKVLIADSRFFEVFGITLLEGDPALLQLPTTIFLSRSTAKRFFGDENPIGQTVSRNRESLTVGGVYADMENSHLLYSAFIPMDTKAFAHLGWHNPDPFYGYIKLAADVTPAQVEKRIQEVLPKFIDVEAANAQGNFHDFYLYPVTKLHSGLSDVRRLVMILSILAFSLLFVAAMNYVLISISSLAQRAKAVGVHKCNGASDKHIFRIFFYETITILLVAMVFALLIIFAFRSSIESIIQTPLSAIFSIHNLWVAGLVLIVLLLLAGVIPAMIFSAVPVTNLFRTYATHKGAWKRMLLFVQFTGAAFMVTLLVIIVKQYDLLLHVDMGYQTHNLYYSENISGVPRTKVALLKAELEQMPEVASVSVASTLPIRGLEGLGAMDIDDHAHTIPCRGIAADSDYLATMGIKLLQGENVGDNSQGYTRAIVNESFVKQMGWKDSPVGKTFLSGLNGKDKPIQVIGVMSDYKISSLNGKELEDLYPPVAFFPLDMGEENWLFAWERVMVKLHDTDEAVVTKINVMMRELLEKPNAFFIDYDVLLAQNYQDALLYRNAILGASLFLLLITALGLIGFTQDEISRRSKEIAIRKIVGAQVLSVLTTITKGIVYIAIPALLMGFALSYLVGAQWLQQFAVKIPLDFFLFASCAVMVLAGIITCVTLRAWQVANENPVRHLRTE
ncbi:ABC transporter permease [Parabacteroides sp. PF5-6]|uniref:ABC transporter permease n=1 Tax=Parabacteroides sp. PF5-6 TaxID=1742403 RepID=UPI002404E4D8|nr:ABC transporter permease [Parabacteroides sp. PF5-6]MDF9831449.1 putative ABC transport system permease protein [Parabacteroides sp. PF5-6]